MIGVTVSTLVERYDTPLGGQRFGERHIGGRFHPMRVQRDNGGAFPAIVEVG